MGIDESDFVREAFLGDVAEDVSEGTEAPFARSRRSGDVVGVVADGTVGEQHVGGLQIVHGSTSKDDGGGRLAEVQARPIGVEGPTRLGGKRFEGLEARDDEARKHVCADDDGRIDATRQQFATSRNECSGTGDAGVGDDERGRDIAEEMRNAVGGVPEVELVGAVASRLTWIEQMDVALRGGEEERTRKVVGSMSV